MRLSLVCAALVVASTANAQARRVTYVVVPLDAANDVSAAYGAHALAGFLATDARFEVVNPNFEISDDAPSREAKGIEAARLLTEGREALDNLDLPKAIGAFDKSIASDEQSDLSITGVQGLIDALALRGLAKLAAGKKADFVSDTERVLTLRPDYVWDRARVTPGVNKALEPIKKKARRATLASLEIASNPTTALAYLDGVFRGVTPLSVGSLPPGAHYVTLTALGYELTQTRVFVGGEGTNPALALNLAPRARQLNPLVAELKAAAARGEPGPSAVELAKFLHVSEVFVGSVRGREARVTRVNVEGVVIGEEHATLDAKPELLWADLARKVAAREAPAVKVVDATPPPSEDAPVVVQSHTGRRVGGWVLAGVAVVSVAGGVVFGLGSKSEAKAADAAPQDQTATYDLHANSARLQAAVADALFATAVVSAAIGIFLLASGYSGGSSDKAPAADDNASLFMVPTRDGAVVGLGGHF